MISKVSVIIPCFNCEKFIDRAIESVYVQDYKNIELIIVDDGSTDESKSKILNWKSKFETKNWDLKYIYQENMGVGGAVNTGLKYVTGKYLSLLDADDEYLQGAISERADYLENHPENVAVRSNGWCVKGEKKWLFVQDKEEKIGEDVFVSLLKGEINNWAGSYMVRTSKLFQCYPSRDIYSSRYGQNLQILLPVVYKEKCSFINKPYMNYVQQEESLSQTVDAKKKLDNLEGYREIRIHILGQFVKEENEYKYYLKQIDASYWRVVMQLAVDYADKTLLIKAFNKLKEIEKPTIDDKITKYKIVLPAYSICLRALRKFRNQLKYKVFNMLTI